MKKYVIIFILLLCAAGVYLFMENKKLNKKYEASIENIKAYDAQLSGLENNNRVFKLTIDQLNYFNDSILQRMNEVRKELGIKDSKLQELQYELSYGKRSDTLRLRDTIFVENFKLDTIVGDKWFRTNLYLEYPNTIALNPEIELERYAYINGKRERL